MWELVYIRPSRLASDGVLGSDSGYNGLVGLARITNHILVFEGYGHTQRNIWLGGESGKLMP